MLTMTYVCSSASERTKPGKDEPSCKNPSTPVSALKDMDLKFHPTCDFEDSLLVSHEGVIVRARLPVGYCHRHTRAADNSDALSHGKKGETVRMRSITFRASGCDGRIQRWPLAVQLPM